MVVRHFLILLILVVVFSSPVKSDTWTDPSIVEMIKESEVIGIFRVITGGPFKASLVPLKVLKGNVSGNIWVTGFSNKYGPINILHPGKVYFLFINKYENHKSRFHSSSNAGSRIIARKIYNAYEFVGQKNNGYLVPTPTSGLYRIRDGRVYIDAAEVNYPTKSLPLADLESMITQSLAGKVDDAVTIKFVSSISNALSTGDKYLASNYVAMLCVSGNKNFLPILCDVSNDPAWEVRFALAVALGSIDDINARDLLVKLAADTSGVVQGEAVRQLTKRETAAFLGPILLKQLSSASMSGEYAALMNPRRNSRNDGLTEIISTLAELKYTAAIPDLLKMLTISDQYTFIQIIRCLIALGSDEYAPMLCERINSEGASVYEIETMTHIIERQNLEHCTPALMDYVTNADRTDHFHESFVISSLARLAAHSQDTSLGNFIVADFNKFLSYYQTLNSYTQFRWLKEYFSACSLLQLSAARPLIYQAFYEWTSYDVPTFYNDDNFKKKMEKEDSLKVKFDSILGSKSYQLDEVICYLPTQAVQRQKFIISVDLPSIKKSAQERKLISISIGIPEDDIFVVSEQGTCWLDCQYRFDKKNNSILPYFINYAKALPDRQDVNFLRAVQKSNAKEAEYFAKDISEAIKTIEEAL